MNTFLPDGYDDLKTTKNYWRLSQMKEGDNRLRIVSKPIAGWVDWQNNKPIRSRPQDKPKSSVDASKPFKAFWACYVWDYAREALFVLEITQNSVLKALAAFGSDADWGDFTKYDIKIKKEGSGKDSKYQVTPMPHKPLGESILKALAGSPIRLEALYEGLDPWNDLVDSKPKERASIVKDNDLFDRVDEMLKIDKDADKLLSKFLAAYNLSSIVEATDEHLKQLESRLIERNKKGAA